MQIKAPRSKFFAEGELKIAGIVICLNKNDQFLIIRRANIDDRVGQWTIPGGHIDEEDESIEEGAIRELQEETGLNCTIGDLQFLDEPKPQKYYFWTSKWGGSLDIGIPNPKTGEVEHDDYRWATILDIKEIANTEIPIYLLEKVLEISKNETNS